MSHRPTLPPLRTLGLPNPCFNLRENVAPLGINNTNDTYDPLVSTVSFRFSGETKFTDAPTPPLRFD